MEFTSTLLMTEFVTHDVKRFFVTRPDGFRFTPGQGVDLAINLPEWKEKSRPFSPTSLAADKILQFTIKRYSEHHGVTEQLHGLEPGAELSISAAWGTIAYRGPGVFIAGGAGITPFIAIIRELARLGTLQGHSLIFSNKTPDDIINNLEFRHYFGERFITVCSRKEGPDCPTRRIDKSFLQERINDFEQNFYTCGPPAFVRDVNGALVELGAHPEALVFER